MKRHGINSAVHVLKVFCCCCCWFGIFSLGSSLNRCTTYEKCERYQTQYETEKLAETNKMFVCVYSGSRVYKTTSINRQWNGIQNMYVRLFSLQFLPKQHTKWRKKNKENWNKEDIRTQNSRYGAVLCTQIIQLDVCVCVWFGKVEWNERPPWWRWAVFIVWKCCDVIQYFVSTLYDIVSTRFVFSFFPPHPFSLISLSLYL